MQKRSKTLIIAGILILIFVFIAFKIINSDSAGKQPRINIVYVQSEKPVRLTIYGKLQYNGNILPIQQANIFSKVGGNLENVLADIGSRVRTNQLLAVIDSTELYQDYQQTFATYYNSKLTYQRTKDLFEQNLVAKQDLDNNEAAMKIALANYLNASTKLSYAKIRAPFSGVITAKFLDRGSLVQANNSTLFTLMKMDSVKVLVNILEKDIPLISKSFKSVIMIDAYPGQEFEGKITRNSQSIDLNTRTITYEIDVPNNKNILKPGMYATIDFLIDKHENVLTVPSDAVLKDINGNYLFIVKKGKAQRVDVKTGLTQNNLVEITKGLNDSDDVITTGQEFVKEGISVKVQGK
jgi:membrane fusion protein (multidrug efflux system)